MERERERRKKSYLRQRSRQLLSFSGAKSGIQDKEESTEGESEMLHASELQVYVRARERERERESSAYVSESSKVKFSCFIECSACSSCSFFFCYRERIQRDNILTVFFSPSTQTE